MKKILLSVSMIAFVGVLAVGATGAFFSDTETSSGNTFTAGSIDLTVDNTSYYNGEFNDATSWLQKDLEEGDLFFDFDDLKPGDWGEDTISLHVANNDSWLCVDVTLTSDDDNGLTEPEEGDGDQTGGVGEGELADAVDFIWWADDGDNVFEDNEDLLPAGPLGFLQVNETATVALADSTGNIWNGNGPLPGDSVLYIGKAWCHGEITLDPVAQDDIGFLGAVGFNGPDVRGAGFSCDGSQVDNTTQSDSMTADISFSSVQSRHNPDFTCNEEGGLGCTENADVIFVLDSSGSIDDTELAIVQSAATAFATALAPSTPGTHIGVVDFDSSAVLLEHLSDVIADINAAIAALVSGGSTDLASGITTASAELANPGDGHDRADGVSPDYMVIITDGVPNSEAAATAAASAAKAAGTTIYVVGVGDGVNESYLETIASSPAHYFSAAEFDDLEALLGTIADCNLTN